MTTDELVDAYEWAFAPDVTFDCPGTWLDQLDHHLQSVGASLNDAEETDGGSFNEFRLHVVKKRPSGEPDLAFVFDRPPTPADEASAQRHFDEWRERLGFPPWSPSASA